MYYDWVFTATNVDNENEAVSGDVFKVAEFLGIGTIELLEGWVNRKLLRKRYFIDAFDENRKYVKPNKKKYTISRMDKDYDYLFRHLKKYGNTVCTFDPEPYRKRLAKNGLDFKAKFKEGGMRRATDGTHYSDSSYYILEVL